VPHVVTIKPRETGEIAIEWSHVYPSTGVTSSTVRRDRNGKALPIIIYDNAYAAVSNMVAIVTASPHIAMIFDKAIPLRPGAELMTIALGSAAAPIPGRTDTSKSASSAESISTSSVAVAEPDGCPISVETDANVKFLAQIEKADVIIHLNEYISFMLAHFNDLPALQIYVNSILGKVSQVAGVGTGSSALATYAKVEVTIKHLTLMKVRSLNSLCLLCVYFSWY
jgi:hypothetical protein